MQSIPIVLDDKAQGFPDPELALDEPNGLIAIGGKLSSEQLLIAYRTGIFPWFNEGDPCIWWSPTPRCLLLPNQFKLSHSFKKSLKKNFLISTDLQFKQVIQTCSQLRKHREGTWITDQMINAYIELFELGYAHSIEVWHENKLIGGLYGIQLGRAFFGESMFHLKTDASKIALYALCHLPFPYEFDFIDCQLPTDHLISLGATSVERSLFLDSLKMTQKHHTSPQKWSFPIISGQDLLKFTR